ncbi:MAG: hypothetical protein EPO08_05910 [Rhodospirillaceae bacterium]|nr:MAG: hypothetical protein EPO08_05910 [Rhodospirillaceae bacterium]
MSFVSPPSRRAVLSQVLAAGITSMSASANARAGNKEAPAPQQSTFFDRFMVRGPFPVRTANPLSFQLPNQNRDLLVRVSYPDPSSAWNSTPFPVVLFSHGELSSKDLYNPIADLWASHGIVAILPTHIDSESLGYKSGEMNQAAVLTSRIVDLTYLLDHLDEITMQAPTLAGHIDKERIGVGGHGFGSAAALALAGLQLKTSSGTATGSGDPRIRALISYNGVGPLPLLGDNWSDITVPTFAAAGTNDPGMAGIDIDQTWRWRMSPFSLTHGKKRFGVSITLGDHTYGGLIGNQDQSDKPDATGLAIVNAMSTAFIAAHLMDNREVKIFLETIDLPAMTDGRAFLERS